MIINHRCTSLLLLLLLQTENARSFSTSPLPTIRTSAPFIRPATRVNTATETSDDKTAVPSTTTTLDGGTSMTQRIMEKTFSGGQTGGAGGVSTYDAFLRADAGWERLRLSNPSKDDPRPPPFVTSDGAEGEQRCWAALREKGGKNLDHDVVVCGGTLGIFVATAMLLKGFSVAVVEAGKLQGREQEWNISRKEMEELVELGVLTNDEVEMVITTEFPGCRSGFKNKEVTPTIGGYFDNGIGYECFTPNVLNLGVSPTQLLEIVQKRFLSLGGTVYDQTPIKQVVISESAGAALDLSSPEDEERVLTSRMILDCMGNASPISRQQRFGMKPDGVCAVVGSCAGGYDKETNLLGDIIYTNTEIQDKGDDGQLQYFWEAFPVGIGRDGKEPGSSDVKTTYMFTYMDATPSRPSLQTLMDDYWRLLPVYQPSITDPEKDLDVKRVLFAYFPTYRNSPLRPDHPRLLSVGDASGIQSPLSFGGFGALTRHLGRISGALEDALRNDLLDKESLGMINAYTPNLSAAWMFQKAMSVRPNQNTDPKFVNRLLATNFEVMDDMGERTMMPFLQDVVRFDGLIGSLARSFVADPTFMPQIVAHVGVGTLVEWLGHFSMIGLYSALDGLASPLLDYYVEGLEEGKERYTWKRRMEAWKFGSGGDYAFEE